MPRLRVLRSSAVRFPADVIRKFFADQARRIRAELAAWWHDNSLSLDWKAALGAVVGGLLFAPLVYQLPLPGLDLELCFRKPANLCGQIPWVDLTDNFLLRWDLRTELALVTSIGGMAMIMAVAREAKDRRGRLLAVALSILTPQMFLLAWTGQIDALGLLGLLLMPAGLPLLLMKPHVYGWAVLSRKWWLALTLLLVLVSFLIWGWWVPRVIAPPGPDREESPIAMGWDKVGWHVLALGLGMMFFTNRDPYRLIAAGSLITPYLQPYHLVALLPALGRVQGWRRWALWGAVWLTGATSIIWVYYMLSVPGFEMWAWAQGPEPIIMPIARHLGLLFPILAWWWLRPERQEPGQVSIPFGPSR